MNAHGGEITAEPNPEGGTIFRFTLQGVPTDGDGPEDAAQGR